ncbi:MAG: aldehyde dehydrogenase family protein, partial [Cyanobacteria bacterium P01_H01_bin.121]
LAQFAGDEAPFNSWDAITKWAADCGYVGVQVPSWDGRLIDLDKAAEDIIAGGAFDNNLLCIGEKQVFVLDGVYDAFLKRLIAATKSLNVGPTQNPHHTMGPVIDETAQANIRKYIEIGKQEATLALEMPSTEPGYFIGPVIFADVKSEATIAQEEIFGPVLAVLPAQTFDEALAIANGTDYALTGGLYSRTPSHIEQVKESFEVGNLYINRGITGAIVARQPFGGFKLSGVGSKAGGPDYLLQFLEPRTITENVQRQGFAVIEGAEQ